MTTTAVRPATRRLADASVEVLLLGGLFLVYRLGRALTSGETSVAFAHGRDVHHLEQLLHLPSEAGLQAAVASAALFHAANVYYVSLHFPVMIAFLVWGYVRRPRAEYRWARNLLIVQTGIALAIHIAFPLAPPRMFPAFGFVDTMTVFGPSAYGGAGASVANQFAAMPSLHIGWAVLIAYVVVRTGPRPLAVVAVLHAVTTTAVVVVTANHWWLDGLVAVAILAVAVLTVPAPERLRRKDSVRTSVPA